MAASFRNGDPAATTGGARPGRAAITGATGFVGLALAERLRASGWEVAGLARASSAAAPRAELQRLGVRLVDGDVTAPETLPALVQGADLVVHSAAVIAYRRRLHAAMEAVNVRGTSHVVRAARAAGVGRLVHVSSIAALGISDRPVALDEEAPFNAAPLRAPYFDTKHAAEQEVQAAVRAGLDAVIVNPGAIYGASAVPSNSNRIVERVAAGRLRCAPAGGINVVPLVTVVDGILAAAARGATGRRYVLGGENLSTRALFERVAAAAGRRHALLTVPAWVGPPLRFAMDLADPCVPAAAWWTPDLCAAFGRWMWFQNRRMREELGVQPADFDACLAQVVAALRRAGRLDG